MAGFRGAAALRGLRRLHGQCREGLGLRIVPTDRLGTAQGLCPGVFGAAILLAGLWADLARQSHGQIPLLVCGTVALTPAAALQPSPAAPWQPDEWSARWE
jgi:hypothetical protein